MVNGSFPPPASIGDTVYVNLRAFSSQWYDSHATSLPNAYTNNYVVSAVYSASTRRNCLALTFPVFNDYQEPFVNPWFVYLYGSRKSLGNATLITPAMVADYHLS